VLGQEIRGSQGIYQKYVTLLIIIGLLAKDPQKRPTIKEVLEDPWISKNFPEVTKLRENAKSQNMFQMYSLPKPNSLKIYDEVAKMSAGKT